MRTLIRYMAWGYFGYIAVSALIVLPALNILSPRLVQENLARELRSEIILFNPFTLSLEVRRAALLEPDGEVFLSTDRAEVNLSLESIWSEGLAFDELAIDSLYVFVRRLADGSFNFSDMLGEPDQGNETDQAGGLPALTVHRLSLASRQIKFIDETLDEPFTTHLNGLDVVVHGVSTVREEGRPYSLDARTESGGRLHWEGDVSVPGAYSEGTLELENIGLSPLWRYSRQWLNFELTDGTVSVSGDYRLDWEAALSYKVSGAEVAVNDIRIQSEDPTQLPETSVALNRLEINGIDVDGVAETVDIATVSIGGVEVHGFDEGDTVSLATLFQTHFPESEPSDEQGNWKISVPTIELADSSVRWRSSRTSPQNLKLSPVAATVSNFHWPAEGKSAIELSTSLNDITHVRVSGDVNLDSGDGSVQYSLENFQLPLLNPNIPSELNAKINRGAMGVKGDVHLSEFAPTLVSMNGEISDFSGLIQDSDEALTSWKSIRWQGLDVDLEQRNVTLEALILNAYSGRLHIYEDGTINAQRVLQQKVNEAVEEGVIEEDALIEWTFDIPSISVIASELNFTDESLPIKFQTVIGQLNGDITGLSSDPGSETVVDLKGSVDGYAPVVLAGTAKPFIENPVVDMGLTFDGVDLVRLTPYSGTYAGYAIDRGILNLDLHYSLEGDHLKGDNSVVVSQLKLGEKVDSDKAVDLPLELALALLTDMNGVIDMDVPVSGNLDDPEFGLGSVIFSAFVNLITKAVTAPFTLLAGLIGSEDDMQRISFSLGSVELDEASKSKLADLSTALAQRPGLNLVLYGRVHSTEDREHIQVALLNEQLQSAGLAEVDIANKSEAWTKAVKVRYKKLALKESQGAEASITQQYQKLVSSISVSEQQLQGLAEERALAVKRYMVNELQFPADRAAIQATDLSDEGHMFSGVELDVDT